MEKVALPGSHYFIFRIFMVSQVNSIHALVNKTWGSFKQEPDLWNWWVAVQEHLKDTHRMMLRSLLVTWLNHSNILVLKLKNGTRWLDSLGSRYMAQQFKHTGPQAKRTEKWKELHDWVLVTWLNNINIPVLKPKGLKNGTRWRFSLLAQ